MRFSGMIVTRRCNPPFFNNNSPVFSLSTTTWYSFPPAVTSTAWL